MESIRAVCPFLSSTFVDFQEEREHLVKKIFPALNSLSEEKGTYFSPVDLRWGITDEQAKNGQVIRTCLDYIEQSAPFFICLLGERYGQFKTLESPLLPENVEELTAEHSWLDRSLIIASQSGHAWVTDGDYKFCSVTELEVQKAAFIDRLQHCYFYLRDPSHVDDKYNNLEDGERYEKLATFKSESEYTTKRIQLLKDKIEDSGYPVRRFRTPQELGEQVLEDWTKLINDLFPQNEGTGTNPRSRERKREEIAQKVFAESKKRVFVNSASTRDIIEDLHNFANVFNQGPNAWDTENVLVLSGKHGSGKSALAAVAVESLRKTSVTPVFAHHVAASASSFDISNFLQRVSRDLRTSRLGQAMSNESNGSNFQEIVQSFIGSLQAGPSIVVIDGLDKLGRSLDCSQKQTQELSWLPKSVPKTCRLIVSCSEGTPVYETLRGRSDSRVITVPHQTDVNSKSEIVKEHLAIHHKSLSERQMQAITRGQLSSTPLYLTTVVNELRLFGSFERLDSYIERYSGVNSFTELWSLIVTRWIHEYGHLNDEVVGGDWVGWVIDALCLISCSRHGLTTSELLDILSYMGYWDGSSKVTSFDVALLRSAAGDALAERDGGVLVLVDDDLIGVLATFMQDSSRERNQKIFCHRQISAYLWQQPHSLRRSLELPWQIQQHEDSRYLRYVLCEPQVFMELYDLKYDHSRRLDLIGYWEYLKSQNVDPSAVYWAVIKQYSPICIDEFEGSYPASAEVFNTLQSQGFCNDLPFWMPKMDDIPDFCRFCSAVGQFLAETSQFEGSEVILCMSHWILSEKYVCMKVKDQMLLCEIQQALAEANYYQLKKKESVVWYERTLETVNKILHKLERRGNDIGMLQNYEIKGKVLDRLGNMKTFDFAFTEAEKLLHEAQECMKTAGSEMGQARVKHHLAILKMRNGQYDESEALLTDCISVLEKWLGKTHPKVADIWNDLADLKADTRSTRFNRKEALDIYTKTLQMREDSLGAKHLLVATTLFHMGKLLVHGRDTAEKKLGILKLWQALNIRAESLGVSHPITKAVKDYIDKVTNRETKDRNLKIKPNINMKQHPSDTSSWWRESGPVRNRITPGGGNQSQTRSTWYNSFSSLNKRNQRRDEHWTQASRALSRKTNNYYHYIDDYYSRKSHIDEVNVIVQSDYAGDSSEHSIQGVWSCSYITLPPPTADIELEVDKLQKQWISDLNPNGEPSTRCDLFVTYACHSNKPGECDVNNRIDALADGSSVMEFSFATENLWEKSERILNEL